MIEDYVYELLKTLPLTDPRHAVFDLNGRENTESILLAYHTLESELPSDWSKSVKSVILGTLFNNQGLLYIKNDIMRVLIDHHYEETSAERGPWWLPSAGEMSLLMSNADIVNRSISTAIKKFIPEASHYDPEDWFDFLVVPTEEGYLTSTVCFYQDGQILGEDSDVASCIVGFGAPNYTKQSLIFYRFPMDSSKSFFYRGVTNF